LETTNVIGPDLAASFFGEQPWFVSVTFSN
jgi:hypothetical protein